jgi:hypothetical protein
MEIWGPLYFKLIINCDVMITIVILHLQFAEVLYAAASIPDSRTGLDSGYGLHSKTCSPFTEAKI